MTAAELADRLDAMAERPCGCGCGVLVRVDNYDDLTEAAARLRAADAMGAAASDFDEHADLGPGMPAFEKYRARLRTALAAWNGDGR